MDDEKSITKIPMITKVWLRIDKHFFFLPPILTAFWVPGEIPSLPNVIKGVYRFTENETHFGEMRKRGELREKKEKLLHA